MFLTPKNRSIQIKGKQHKLSLFNGHVVNFIAEYYESEKGKNDGFKEWLTVISEGHAVQFNLPIVFFMIEDRKAFKDYAQFEKLALKEPTINVSEPLFIAYQDSRVKETDPQIKAKDKSKKAKKKLLQPFTIWNILLSAVVFTHILSTSFSH